MNNNHNALSVTLECLLATVDSSQLDALLHKASEECLYASHVPVAWSYWHYGRHAEFAHDLGMPELARLFSAAWSIEYDVHNNDTETANIARQSIRDKYR